MSVDVQPPIKEEPRDLSEDGEEENNEAYRKRIALLKEAMDPDWIANEEAVKKWEMTGPLNEENIKLLKSMPEISRICHFLLSSMEVMGLDKIDYVLTLYQMERMLLVPQSCRLLNIVMTSIFSNIIEGKRIIQDVMPYEVWNAKVCKRLSWWYQCYKNRGNLNSTVFDITPLFWEVLGPTNPMKDFHHLSVQQRAVLLMTLCENVMNNKQTVRKSMADIIPDCPMIPCGTSCNGDEYFHLRLTNAEDIRVFRTSKSFAEYKGSTEPWWEERRPLSDTLASLSRTDDKLDFEEEISISSMETVVWPGLTEHHCAKWLLPDSKDFFLVADSIASLRDLIAVFEANAVEPRGRKPKGKAKKKTLPECEVKLVAELTKLADYFEETYDEYLLLRVRRQRLNTYWECKLYSELRHILANGVDHGLAFLEEMDNMAQPAPEELLPPPEDTKSVADLLVLPTRSCRRSIVNYADYEDEEEVIIESDTDSDLWEPPSLKKLKKRVVIKKELAEFALNLTNTEEVHGANSPRGVAPRGVSLSKPMALTATGKRRGRPPGPRKMAVTARTPAPSRHLSSRLQPSPQVDCTARVVLRDPSRQEVVPPTPIDSAAPVTPTHIVNPVSTQDITTPSDQPIPVNMPSTSKQLTTAHPKSILNSLEPLLNSTETRAEDINLRLLLPANNTQLSNVPAQPELQSQPQLQALLPLPEQLPEDINLGLLLPANNTQLTNVPAQPELQSQPQLQAPLPLPEQPQVQAPFQIPVPQISQPQFQQQQHYNQQQPFQFQPGFYANRAAQTHPGVSNQGIVIINIVNNNINTTNNITNNFF